VFELHFSISTLQEHIYFTGTELRKSSELQFCVHKHAEIKPDRPASFMQIFINQLA